LEEPDELEPVQALGVRLVGVDLRQPRVDGWVGGDEAVDVGEPEVSADPVQHGVDGRVPQSAVVEVADVQLEVGTLESEQRVEGVAVTRGQPACALVGVQRVRLTGIPG
jgi:hypothetical protein